MAQTGRLRLHRAHQSNVHTWIVMTMCQWTLTPNHRIQSAMIPQQFRGRLPGPAATGDHLIARHLVKHRLPLDRPLDLDPRRYRHEEEL